MRYSGNSRPIIMVTLAVCALMMATVTAAAVHPGTWAARADLPDRLYLAATAEVEGVIYVIGGSPDTESVDTVFAYDSASNLWSERSAIPTARSAATAAVVDNKIYVFGGTVDLEVGTVTTSVEAYDPATDTWQNLGDMPSAYWGSAAATVDGKIYVIGGGTGDILGEFNPYSSVQIFDPAADSWYTGAPMPTPRATLSVAVIDGLIYAVGGADSDSASNALEIYDPAIDTWMVAADMSIARDWSATAAVDGEVYALGGFAWGPFSEMSIIREVEVFDPQTGQWDHSTRMPDQRFGLGAVAVDDMIYLVGGADRLMVWAENHVDTYEPNLYTSWTEVAAHLSGAYGSQWRTDLCAANLNNELANVDLTLHTETGTHSHSDTIEATRQKSFLDVVGEMGIDGKGLLQISSDQVLKIAGRTFSDGGDGTFGQFCSFQPMDAGFGKGDHDVYLIGLRQDEGLFRTNLIFANTGIREATMYVTLFRCSGDPLGTFFVSLEPGQLDQRFEVFANEGAEPNLGWGYARVMVAQGAGVRISASVIDSRTNDATTIMAQR